jgi:glutamate dehydrogenase
LRDEIVATVMINEVINRMGAAFVNKVMDKTATSLPLIMKAYFIAVEVFHFQEFWDELESYDGRISAEQQLKVYKELLNLLKRIIFWLLRYYPLEGSITDLVQGLSLGVTSFLRDLTDCLDAEGEDKLAQAVVSYQDLGVDNDFAERCALLTVAANSPNIVLLASSTGFTIQEVGTLYFLLGSRFSFGKIRVQVRHLPSTSSWVTQQIAGLLEDLYTHQSDLTLRILHEAQNHHTGLSDGGVALIAQWELDHADAITRLDQVLSEANITRCQELSTLSVITRELRLLSTL